MNETKFQVGDIVRAFGVRGEVKGFIPGPTRYNPTLIHVELEGGFERHFLLDGRHLHWHKESSLKLIERPKKKE